MEMMMGRKIIDGGSSRPGIVHSIKRWVHARVAMMPNPVEVSGR